MDIKQLKRFLDLYETKNFTKTAENLFLSQQTLSSSINALEEEIGRALFKRTKRGVVPTEEGEFLKELCTPLVQSFDAMTSELNRRFDYKKRKLLFGLAQGVLQASSPDLLLRFRMAYPNFELKAIESPDTICVENVMNGIVDLAFCPRPPKNPLMEYIHLRSEKLYAVINKNSPLAKEKTLSVADLKEEKLVSLNKYYQVHDTILSCCRAHGFLPDFVVESGESGVLLSMVKLNMCVFICMEYIANEAEKNSCVKIPISDKDMVWEYGLIYKKDKKPDHSARQFMEYLNAAIATHGPTDNGPDKLKL